MKIGDNLLEAKNKVRGAINTIGKRSGNPKSSRSRSRRIIRGVLLDARREIHYSDWPKFFDWLEGLDNGQNVALRHALTSDLVASIIKSKGVDLGSELRWINLRLRSHINTIKQFRKLAINLSHCFWSQDLSRAQAVIAEINKLCGPSLWVLNAEIAVRQELEGLEAQKDALKSISSKYARGLPSYLAFYFSKRNEPQTSLAVFDDEFHEHLQKLKVSKDPSIYLTYKILNKVPPSAEAMATVLRIEQGHNIVDIYETAIDILQKSLVGGLLTHCRDATVEMLLSFMHIGDTRVDKLLFALTGQVSEGSVCNAVAPENSDNSTTALNAWDVYKKILDSKPDISKSLTNLNSYQADIVSNIESIFRRDDSFEDSLIRLAKFGRNFSFDLTARALEAIINFGTMRVQSCHEEIGVIALNCAHFSEADLFIVQQPTYQRAIAFLQSRVGSDLVSRFDFQSTPITTIEADPIRWYLHALFMRKESVEDTIEILDRLSHVDLPKYLRVLASNLRIQTCLQTGDWRAAVAEMSAQIGIASNTVSIMPVKDALLEKNWDQLQTAFDKIDLAVTLYALWKQTDESLHATYVRFAFEDVLMQLDALLPGELCRREFESDPRLLFFLKFICVPVLMDTSGFFLPRKNS